MHGWGVIAAFVFVDVYVMCSQKRQDCAVGNLYILLLQGLVSRTRVLFRVRHIGILEYCKTNRHQRIHESHDINRAAPKYSISSIQNQIFVC